MVSPTKPKSPPKRPHPQPANHAGDQKTPTSYKPRKSVRSVFHNKRFYLDVKSRAVSSAKIRELVDDIQTLGGTIEEFFSKEVTTVISDAPDWKLANPAGKPDVVSPGTPCSLQAIANSPWSPATPVDDKEKRTARCRVETILERARQQAKGTSDVIENAHKWGLKIWSLHKVFTWLENFKAQMGGPLRRNKIHYTRSHSVDSGLNIHGERKLKAPYLKYEASNPATKALYKPVFTEYKRFPQIYVNGRAGYSPFYPGEYSNPMPKTHHDPSYLADQREALKLQNKNRHRDQRQSRKASPKTKSGKRKGFCEICEVNYSDLDDHVESTNHQHVVRVNSYWSKVDICIGLVNMNSDDSVHEFSDGRS